MDSETRIGDFKTKDGRTIKAYFRDRRNDYNTLLSIISYDEYKIFDHYIQGLPCIDIGAHIGGATLSMASLGARVICVEALPENVKLLKMNIEINGFQDRVTVVHKAISDSSGSILKVFYTEPKDENGVCHEFIGSIFSGGNKFAEVETISLTDIFSIYGIDQCRFMKIDCEGSEWGCFEKMPLEMLDRIDIISGELHCCLPEHTPQRFYSLFKGKFNGSNLTNPLGSFFFSRRTGDAPPAEN